MEVPTDELANAEALVERGELKAALNGLEQVRRSALAGGDVPALEEVLRLAGLVHEQTDGKLRSEAGRLAYSARENIRFVGRRQALADRREWIDPFEVSAPAVAREPLGRSADAEPVFTGGDRWWAEPRWLPWVAGVWLLALVATAVIVGTAHTVPGEEVSPSTWATDMAVAGIVFGLILGLLAPRRLWRGGECLVPLVIGAGTYALAYFIAHAIAYDGGDEGDTGGMGLVIVVFAIACIGPMLAAAAAGALIRVAVAYVRQAASGSAR